jgi:hypothetical protein
MHVDDNRRTRYTFFIDAPTREALARIKERDGVPESEQIRRALKKWLEEKGELGGEERKAGRKRA